MKIPAKSDDAVRTGLALARVWPGRLSADAIASSEGLPWRFVQQILGDLRRAGLVQSRRGPLGGYVLTRAPEEIEIATVLAAVESPLVEPARSPSGREPVGTLWCEVADATHRVLQNCSLGSLLTRGEYDRA